MRKGAAGQRLAHRVGERRVSWRASISHLEEPLEDRLQGAGSAEAVPLTTEATLSIIASRAAAGSFTKEERMPRKPQVAVEPRPDGRWAVQTDGTQRADSLHNRKSDAVTRARELAENKKTELVIKNAKGQIGPKDSHGRDPRKIKG